MMIYYIGKEQLVSYDIVKMQFEGDDGEMIRCRVGLRFYLANGERWFYHFRFQSWTHTIPGRIQRYRSQTPMYDNHGRVIRGKPTVRRYKNDAELQEKLGHSTIVLDLLNARRIFE